MEWREANEPTKVKFGLLLSGAKLVDNQDFREQLRAFGPEAIGGEMEGAGLYAAAQGNKVDWILVKAICDWADGNKGNDKQSHQEAAAANAARFVINVINQGGLRGEKLQGTQPGHANNVQAQTGHHAIQVTMNANSPEVEAMLRRKREMDDFDVFLCYNSVDKAEVKKIGMTLKAHGILPWLDEWELPPGQSWQRLLEQQIGKIKSAVVFVGKDGVGPWQQMELEAFLREFVDRGCPVIPVVLADAPEKPQLPVFLRGMTWVDFHKREPDPMKQLIWGITSKRLGTDASKDAHDAAAITQPPVPKVTSLSFSKKGELVDDLLACACISNRDSRQTVLSLLNEQFPGITDSISRRPDNRADVMEIISTCLKHTDSLAVLVDIVCYLESETSIYAQQLRSFMQNNAL